MFNVIKHILVTIIISLAVVSVISVILSIVFDLPII